MSELERLQAELDRLEYECQQRFGRLVRTDVGTPSWAMADEALRDTELRIAGVRARIARLNAEVRGERHLRRVQ